ncbi:hypothetical protein BX286_4780 [Streptomyces sp. 3211.6]|nr:hypothetical protein BX286_4780 [Streptomyces sp. 3211.6]RPF45655.1 hypothetical protein EDD96_2217 [Streptomyces sp. Ag109_G2-6]
MDALSASSTVGRVSETDRPRPRRRGPLRAALGLAVLLAVIGYVLVHHYSNGGIGSPYCRVTAKGAAGGSEGAVQTYEMTPEQASNAATIAAVGISKGLPDRALTIALATAMQESGLRNLDHGDRDSLGLFQQRPSQGWGTPEQIMDPVYSAGIFYDRLVEVNGYTRLPLTVAAQRVQLSGFPQAYAKHEPDATVLTAAFGEGEAPATLTCAGPAPVKGDPEKVRTELARAFGKEALSTGRTAPHAGPKASASASAKAGAGSAPKASGSPAPKTSASPSAGSSATPAAAPSPSAGAPEAEVDLWLKDGGGPGEARRGRAMAHWAVARAGELGIARVSYDGSAWVAGGNRGEWQRDGAGGTKGGTAPDPYRAVPGQVRIFFPGSAG